MNRIEYIESLLDNNEYEYDSFSVIYSLIMALKPKHAIMFFDLNFDQHFKLRRWILRKIILDMKTEYLADHERFTNNLIDMVKLKKNKKRDSCAAALYSLCDTLPEEKKAEVLELFLNSSYVSLRRRGYKILKTNWGSKYIIKIQELWIKYHDDNCIDIIINNFPKGILYENLNEYTGYFNSYYLSKLFLKIAPEYPDTMSVLKKLNEISYAYVSTKLGKKISNKEAISFLKNNYMDESIGLLIWCYGQMSLWDAIVCFEEKYRKQIPKQF